MGQQILTVGDWVSWRGSWGKDAPKNAKVGAIEFVQPGHRDGKPVTSIFWRDVKAHAVVTLTNGHWAYGKQILPMQEADPEGSEFDDPDY